MEKSCNIIEEIKDYLLKNQDLQYKKFLNMSQVLIFRKNHIKS